MSKGKRIGSHDVMEQAIEAALLPRHFISYDEGWSFLDGLRRVAQRIAQLASAEPGHAVALYETFLAGCHEKAEEIDDSDGELGTFVVELFRGWVVARQAAGTDPEETARQIIAWMEDDPYGFCSDLARDLVEVLDKPELAAFERRLREQLERTVAPAKLPPGRQERDRAGDAAARPPRWWADALRPVLAAQHNIAAYVALCDRTGLMPQDCLVLARMHQARRRPADALAWVERGLALAGEERPWSHGSELGRLRRELLQKLGRGDVALAAAWAEFQRSPSKLSYAELMRYVPSTERSVWHQKAMDAAEGTALYSLIDLWLETRELDRLADRLGKATDADLEAISHYATEPAAQQLARTHPAVAARVYRALGLRIPKARKSKYYAAALASLADARRCYARAGLDAQWDALVREVRAEHRRKVGFMASFERLVAGANPRTEPSFLEQAKARWSRSPHD